jgi:hypothetical protein
VEECSDLVLVEVGDVSNADLLAVPVESVE